MHEPHVAEDIFQQMLREARVTVLLGHALHEKSGVKKNGAAVTEIAMKNGDSFAPDIFIDSSYEGDLMAQAGVSYTWGRESSEQYGESLGGVRRETPKHQFSLSLSPRRAHGTLLPETHDRPAGHPGAPDRKVQAYTFRMCFSDDRPNQVRFPHPADYTPQRYQLLARLLKARTDAEGAPPKLA